MAKIINKLIADWTLEKDFDELLRGLLIHYRELNGKKKTEEIITKSYKCFE